jgi:hypothetical protein
VFVTATSASSVVNASRVATSIRGRVFMCFDAHAARSNIHIGNSNERPTAAPSRLHRATLPLAFSTTS